MSITKQLFGYTKNKDRVDLFKLENSTGSYVNIITYGGAIQSIVVPDRHSNMGDVCLGFDNLASYEENGFYIGALIGRYANRIAKGKFALNGEVFQLNCNNGNNHLHGGNVGFDKRIWEADVVYDKMLVLKLESCDGDENYPGNLSVTVTYEFTDENELKICYKAVCDKDTPINLTNHCYFNLTSDPKNNTLEHELFINAEYFTPINNESIPLGTEEKVDGSAFDFRIPKKIGAGIESDNIQLKYGNGYDHNFVLSNADGSLTHCATLCDAVTGRGVKVFTTKPGLQLYTGNFLDNNVIGKSEVRYLSRSGVCLETQYFPNSVNVKSFPSPILKRGETYEHITIFKFYTM